MVTDPSEPSRTLEVALELSGEYLRGLPGRPVGPRADSVEIMAALGRDLAEAGIAPDVVIREMAVAVEPGLVASSRPALLRLRRRRGPAGVHRGRLAGGGLGPERGPARDVAGRRGRRTGGGRVDARASWACRAEAGFGLPGGAGLANVGGASPRPATPCSPGWAGTSRPVASTARRRSRVLIGAEAHATLESALQYLGLGRERVVRVPTDEQGRMRADAFACSHGPASDGPAIVCSQAGNVNSGAFDPIDAHRRPSGRQRPTRGTTSTARSGSGPQPRRATGTSSTVSSGLTRWATDAHKWLNVGYDCGFVACRDPEAQRSGDVHASCLPHPRRQPTRWLGVGPRQLAACPRLRPVCHAPVPGP